MKKFFHSLLAAMMLLAVGCGEAYDDSALTGRVNKLEDRVEQLEQLCKQMNTNISSLQTIVNALQKNVTITNVSPITEGGKTIGYTITFSDGKSITIYNGTDGQDGSGSTPTIGVEKDSDGCYYWTLNGDWLLDKNGNKVKAQGTDGKDGQDGQDGTNGTNGTNGTDGEDGKDGTDGKDGVTPKLKIENGYWYVSYDNGATWTNLGKATSGSSNGGNTSGIDVTETDTHVIFTLPSGSEITLPKSSSKYINFLDNAVELTCILNWDTNGDGRLSYEEAAAVTNLERAFSYMQITAFPELQYFTGLKAINESEFAECRLLQIILPENITSIGDYAFEYNRFKNIVIPDKVTSIGNYAFDDCSKLLSINIPDSVKEIGYSAFAGCDTLATVTLPKNLTKIEDNTFAGCRNLTSINIPESVTKIGGHAFSVCPALKSIKLPEGITTIERGTFSGCSSLTEINIPESVTKIGESAFCGCSALTSIDLPANLKEIEGGAFNECGFTSFTFPAIFETIPEILSGCSKIEKITLPEGVKGIDGSAFSHLSSLKEINIPESVTTIGSYAFMDCPSLTSIDLPEKLTHIGDRAFHRCTNLATVNVLAKETIYVGEYCFAHTALSNIDALLSKGSFRSGCFNGCKNITEVNVPAHLEWLSSGWFIGCSNLTSLIINGNTEIYWGYQSIILVAEYDGSDYFNATYMSTISPLKKITYNSGVEEMNLHINNVCYNKFDDEWGYIEDHSDYTLCDLPTIYCKPTTAPEIRYFGLGDDDNWDNNNYGTQVINEDFSIYVPHESVNSYKAAFATRADEWYYMELYNWMEEHNTIKGYAF